MDLIKEITVTTEDFKKYSKFAFARLLPPKASGWRYNTISLVVWFIVAVVFITIFKSQGFSLSKFHWPSGLAAALPFAIFISAFAYNFKKIEKRSLPKQNGLMLGKRTIKIDESGITDTSRLGISTYSWDALDVIEEHKGNVYLFVDTMLAQIIPSSAFNSRSEMEEFIDHIEKMQKNHFSRLSSE